ncbi:MAG: YajQ family cyclic di-GMP-binding protein [Gemmatimonadota bacterium]
MAKSQSFDVVSKIDMQEVDNALNQARAEVGQRYDFKGTTTEISLDAATGEIHLLASDEYKLQALRTVVRERLARRKVPLSNLTDGKIEPAAGGASRMDLVLQQGIPGETGKVIAKFVRDLKLKGVQAQIQGDQLRIQGPKRDDLQAVMQHLRGEDFRLDLQFVNLRGQ